MNHNHTDILIVGAGISGVGFGYHLQDKCPDKSYRILERRNQIGGTWDLFRYPGIRSDSNMYTLSYQFNPWYGDKAIAEGDVIREYVNHTAQKYGIDQHILYHRKVKSASWSSKKAQWTITTENTDNRQTETFTCNFLQLCAGYYSYDKGHTPHFEGWKDFQGEIIHPQHWPENFDVNGKRIIVIGSGATAMTLVPSLAKDAAHVTMLQRSPTYVVSLPGRDSIARLLYSILPKNWAQSITRRKNIYLERYFYRLAKTKPEKVKRDLIERARKALPKDFDMDKHFTPRYNPWDQRLCLIPDDDLFKAISHEKASIVTNHIDRFTKEGILLKSGEELKADIIITATGLNLVILGEVAFDIDGKPVDFSKTWIYKGMMYSGIPNMAANFGYINASWTLRVDIQDKFICRVLNHMDKEGMRQVTPTLRASDTNMPSRPLVDEFSSGYLQRVMDQFPKQGEEPWVSKQDYHYEREMLRESPIEDGILQFTHQVSDKATQDDVAVSDNKQEFYKDSSVLSAS